MKCLGNVHPADTDQPRNDEIVIDGAVAVQILPPRTASAFQQYSDTVVFKPFFIEKAEVCKKNGHHLGRLPTGFVEEVN